MLKVADNKTMEREQYIISDDVIYFIPYKKSEIIYSNFKIDDWHNVVSDINSDEELSNALDLYKHIDGYILKRCDNNESIAFLYIKKENQKKSIVSIHGGGWNKSIYLTFLYYRGYVLMIEHLLNKGYKVRTTCLCTNKLAYRFIRSIGFVKYKSSGTYNYFWINSNRLSNNKINKYLKLHV